MPEKEKPKERENRKETTLKQGIILSLITLIVILLIGFYLFKDIILQNAVWILALIAFGLILWKGEILVKLTEFERAVIYRMGKVSRVGGPGWTLVIPGLESYKVVDIRTHTLDIPPQVVVTKDDIRLDVDAVIYLAVNKDPESVIKSVIAVRDYEQAATNYVKGIIRDSIGEMRLDEVISKIDKLNSKLMQSLAAISKDWGIKVESVAITDVVIPEAILTAMHKEKASRQERRERIQRAEAVRYEIEAVRKAASKLDDKTLAYYYLEALKKLGEGKATKFIFPMELTRLAGMISGQLGGTVPTEKIESELIHKYKDVIKDFLQTKKENLEEKPAVTQAEPAEKPAEEKETPKAIKPKKKKKSAK